MNINYIRFYNRMYFFGLQEDRPITGRTYKRPFTALQQNQMVGGGGVGGAGVRWEGVSSILVTGRSEARFGVKNLLGVRNALVDFFFVVERGEEQILARLFLGGGGGWGGGGLCKQNTFESLDAIGFSFSVIRLLVTHTRA